MFKFWAASAYSEQFSQQPKSSTTGSGRFGHSAVVCKFPSGGQMGRGSSTLSGREAATTSVPSVSGGGRVVAVSTGGPRGASGYRLIERDT